MGHIRGFPGGVVAPQATSEAFQGCGGPKVPPRATLESLQGPWRHQECVRYIHAHADHPLS